MKGFAASWVQASCSSFWPLIAKQAWALALPPTVLCDLLATTNLAHDWTEVIKNLFLKIIFLQIKTSSHRGEVHHFAIKELFIRTEPEFDAPGNSPADLVAICEKTT